MIALVTYDGKAQRSATQMGNKVKSMLAERTEIISIPGLHPID